MTPVIKIYMTYYDVICHLSWSCRMVYVFHLLLQTWQSQSYSDITNDMTFIIYQRLLKYPFSVIVNCCNNGTCEQWESNKLTFSKKSYCSATCSCPLLCSANVTHNESWQLTVVICHFSFLLRDVICLVVVLYMTSTAKWTPVNEHY